MVNHPQLIIGIVGNGYRSGKGSVADALKLVCNTRDVSVVAPAFADPIKEIALRMGWDREKDDKGRKLLQLLGTECGRACVRETIWIEKMAARIAGSQFHRPTVVAIPDVRFKNEAEWVKSQGGVIFRVHRVGYDCNDSHQSETEAVDIVEDAYIESRVGTMEELIPKVQSACATAKIWSKLFA